MALSQEASLMLGVAVGAGTIVVHQAGLPSIADIRQTETDNLDVARSERTAAVISVAMVTGVALIARDAGVFIVGGLTFLAINYWYKHANAVSPLSGTVLGSKEITVPGQVSETPVSSDVIYTDETV